MSVQKFDRACQCPQCAATKTCYEDYATFGFNPSEHNRLINHSAVEAQSQGGFNAADFDRTIDFDYVSTVPTSEQGSAITVGSSSDFELPPSPVVSDYQPEEENSPTASSYEPPRRRRRLSFSDNRE